MVKKSDIGLGAKAPSNTCNDVKCPWHGNLKVRGRIFKGRVASLKSLGTAIVEWDYYYKIKKYERSERRRTRVTAHLPACIELETGDTVRIGECRPLSKTKRYVVIEKLGEKE